MRFARKRDQSENLIVKTLRTIGCDVELGQEVDAYVRTPNGQSFMLEIKTPGPNQNRRQRIQKRLAVLFPEQYKVAKTPLEALQAIGYYSAPTFKGEAP